ncbi:hypothetical protein K3757_06935 [Sulfitobacter sp. S223]|uniref:hypothetical protein n=1 Tax=Sulfitobacter sp. S223 TaxID=2867023 RepID=UPI0021A791C0|nr:hypothetical protein [Sulfitobacter sp. S223]UWR27663.1 hypothetical protein K3757_06935 [Sulfitobacter sp. S223]
MPKLLAALALVFSQLSSQAALAETSLSIYGISEVLAKSTSTSMIAPDMLLSASADGGYLCRFDIQKGIFAQVEQGVAISPGYLPRWTCLSVQELEKLTIGGN